MASLPPPATKQYGQWEYAGFLLRLLAFMTDYVVLAVAALLVFLLLGIDKVDWNAAVVSTVMTTLYFVYCNGRWGATPGKMLLCMRIFCVDGTPLTYSQAFLRYSPYLALGAISLFLPEALHYDPEKTELSLSYRVLLTIQLCWYCGSAIYMQTRKDRRTLHDVIAYTVVMSRKRLQ